MKETIARGTSSHSPDLDWSQVRETVLMLELAAGQVDAAMRDSNNSVGVLTDTFTSIVNTLQSLEQRLAKHPNADADLLAETKQVTHSVHQAIIAFQFYDKLSQRLDHVCQSLAGLSGLVSDKGRLFNPGEWRGLQDQIRIKYTMAEERAMFDAVLNGKSVQEALQAYMDERMKEVEQSGGDIELF